MQGKIIKGIAIASANDAAVAVAEHIGGTEENFVKMMNDKLRALNLKDSNFKNCHGLDEEGHYSSAYDMAMIAKELIKHEKILEFSSIYEDYLRKNTDNIFWLVNTNKLVRFYEGADGLKTGFTDDAGYTMVTTAKRNNMRLIAVALGETVSKVRNEEITNLLDYGFNAYKVNIDDSTLKYLIEVCGTSMQELINESRKLIEYAGENGTVNRYEVDLLCIKEVDAVIFTLTDSLGKKDIRNAIETLNNLIYNKEPIQKILITLYNHFKKLYFTKLALEEKKDIAQALNLKPNQLFLASKYKTQAGYFSKEELKKVIDELIKLDKNSKIGLIDLNVGLEAILSKYCSK